MPLLFFPTPYPDELWYSVLCRYHMRSGNTSNAQITTDIFGKTKTKISVFFASDVNDVAQYIGPPCITPKGILTDHTLMPYYTRFWSAERKARVYQGLLQGIPPP